jgi:hypothetical protein
MTREQINTIYTDLGIEAPNKGIVNALLNAFNAEKGAEIDNAKKTTKDEVEAKYKGYIKPEDHQKIVDELEAEKGKGAKAERRSKYEKANLNVDDEDLFNLIDSKLKDSQDFDKDLADYVKAHPSFIKATKDDKDKGGNQEKKKVTIGGTDSEQGVKDIKNDFSMQDAVKDYYTEKK